MMEYCSCIDRTPCACSKMDEKPHCQWCCLSLPLEDEIRWRKDIAKSILDEG